jgi:hypothetical protein
VLGLPWVLALLGRGAALPPLAVYGAWWVAGLCLALRPVLIRRPGEDTPASDDGARRVELSLRKNGIMDYWTRDVAGLHAVYDSTGKCVQLIDQAFACADSGPGMQYPELQNRGPKQGYHYRAMTIDASGHPYVDPASPLPQALNCPKEPCTNLSRFGFTGSPADYGADGTLTIVVDETGTIWDNDYEFKAPVLDRRLVVPGKKGRGWLKMGEELRYGSDKWFQALWQECLFAALVIAGVFYIIFKQIQFRGGGERPQ